MNCPKCGARLVETFDGCWMCRKCSTRYMVSVSEIQDEFGSNTYGSDVYQFKGKRKIKSR